MVQSAVSTIRMKNGRLFLKWWMLLKYDASFWVSSQLPPLCSVRWEMCMKFKSLNSLKMLLDDLILLISEESHEKATFSYLIQTTIYKWSRLGYWAIFPKKKPLVSLFSHLKESKKKNQKLWSLWQNKMKYNIKEEKKQTKENNCENMFLYSIICTMYVEFSL